MGPDFEKGNLYWIWTLVFLLSLILFFHFVQGTPKASRSINKTIESSLKFVFFPG